LQITDKLWLCPHAAFGEASWLKGAVEEARRLLERAGGYDAVLGRIVAEEQQRKEERRTTYLRAQQHAQRNLRYSEPDAG
jgi:hypothetical protein